MRKFSMAILMLVLTSGVALAQPEEKKQEGGGPPPALVTVVEISEGQVQPMAEFVGTVFYPNVSKVSPEVDGKVVEVRFEEGRRVKQGETLVVLDHQILDATIASTEASHEQILVQLEKARKDFGRIETLYREESVSESVYDENFFRVKELEKQAQSLAAELDRLKIEREKKTIRSPFAGVVIQKTVEKGQWVSPAGEVAVVASDGELDVMVDVPERILGFLSRGDTVGIGIGEKSVEGKIWAFIPRGDVSTRTFPVKIRIKNPKDSFKEGMEARVVLPSSEKISGLMVPRNAVIKKFGMDVLFAIIEGKAKMVPVEVVGYYEMMVGVRGPGLEPGMKVAMEGNERIMDGQPVTVIEK